MGSPAEVGDPKGRDSSATVTEENTVKMAEFQKGWGFWRRGYVGVPHVERSVFNDMPSQVCI